MGSAGLKKLFSCAAVYVTEATPLVNVPLTAGFPYKVTEISLAAGKVNGKLVFAGLLFIVSVVVPESGTEPSPTQPVHVMEVGLLLLLGVLV